jgi:hypothetical protein
MGHNEVVRFILSSVVLFSALSAQEIRLLVANAAKPYSILREAPIAPRSLIDLSIAPQLETQPFWFDTTQAISVRFEPKWFQESIALEVLESPNPSTLRLRVPEGTATGDGILVLRVNDRDIANAPVRIVPANLGIFSISNGSGPAIAQNVRSSGAQLNGLTRPARPGDFLTIWGTGLGATQASQVEARLNGTPIHVQYAGPAPGQPGVDQFNLRIPETFTAEGCYVPLQLSASGEMANVVTVATSRTGDPCVHPLGLSTRQMAALDQGGTAPIGHIGIYTLIGPPPDSVQWDLVTRMDHADAGFYEVDASGLWRQSLLKRSETPGQCTAEGSVSIGGFLSAGGSVSMGDRVRVSGAGRALDLMPYNPEFPTGYNGERPRSSPQPSPDLLPPSFWTPGQWTINAPGSSAAGPLNATIDIPPAIEIINFAAVKDIDRSRDLTIEWNGRGYLPEHSVDISIFGSRTVQVNPFSSTTGSHRVSCTAPATAGRIVVPSTLLREFDARDITPESSASLSINLSVLGKIIDVPQKDSDPIRTAITFDSGEWFGISIR